MHKFVGVLWRGGGGGGLGVWGGGLRLYLEGIEWDWGAGRGVGGMGAGGWVCGLDAVGD